MAKLGENLYELKIQMLDLSNQLQKQQTAAEKAAQEGALDMDLKIYYDRMKEAEIQQRVLQKSSRTIVATISSLESQENVEKIKKVLHYTIETHKMAKNNMMEETTSEELLAGFETISSTIDEERMVLDNLDNHITELRTNPDEIESAEVDSNFLLWKNKLKLGKTNQLQTEKKQQEENILAPATLSYWKNI